MSTSQKDGRTRDGAVDFQSVRKLWWEFDPIGVADDPNSMEDEYDRYVIESFELMRRDPSVEMVEDYIWSVLDHIGVDDSPDRVREFAIRLSRLMVSE